MERETERHTLGTEAREEAVAREKIGSKTSGTERDRLAWSERERQRCCERQSRSFRSEPLVKEYLNKTEAKAF
jgi:hypothetical protein